MLLLFSSFNAGIERLYSLSPFDKKYGPSASTPFALFCELLGDPSFNSQNWPTQPLQIHWKYAVLFSIVCTVCGFSTNTVAKQN